MIYYFSGTGNSRFIAQELAKHLNQELLPVEQMPQEIPDEPAIMVCPIYAWLVPEIVMKALRRFQSHNSPLYLVVTCGDNVGQAIERVKREVHLRGAYSIIMPNNYVIGFSIDDENVQTRKILKAQVEAEKIAGEIAKDLSVERYEKGRFAWYFGSTAGKLFQKYARGTNQFFSQEQCISCDVCARDCPAEAIEMKDGRPSWVKKNCEMCLKCLHACPVEAIQYGRSTLKKERYTFDKWLVAHQKEIDK